MEIIDTLKALYDKHSQYCVSEDTDWSIIETAENAELKKLLITAPNRYFGIIRNPFYNGLESITSTRSSYLKDKNCDGIAFYDNGNDKRILFIDLKSSLSFNNIKKAIKQNYYSFLKLQMMLSLCKNYDLGNYDIYFLIACRICNDDMLTSIKDNILMQEELGDMDYSNYCLRSFLFNGNNWSCKLGQLPFSNNSLREDILLKKINFKILTTGACDDTELRYSI